MALLIDIMIDSCKDFKVQVDIKSLEYLTVFCLRTHASVLQKSEMRESARGLVQ